MLKYCLDKWNKNRHRLKEWLWNDPKINSCDYKYLVELVVNLVLNADDDTKWDTNDITEVNNGDYQGTLLYLIPRYTYQPSEDDYLMTYVNYGSCSGCDTLLNIRGRDCEQVTEQQVKDYMALCKDLLTNMIKPYNRGWRNDERFDPV